MHKSAFGSILHVLQGLSAGKLFGCFAGILHLLQNWFLQHVSIGGRSLAWDHLADFFFFAVLLLCASHRFVHTVLTLVSERSRVRNI